MMNRPALFLLILAGATLGEVEKRVIGGEDCKNNEGRHHVILTVLGKNNKPDPNYHCGGSLISAEWILTAAHCDEPNLVAIINRHPDPAKQTVGKISERHQYQNKDGRKHDIMLLKLRQGVLFRTRLDYLTSVTAKLQMSTNLFVFGWFTAKVQTPSLKKEDSEYPDKLQCGDLKIKACEKPSFYQNQNDIHVKTYSYSFILCAFSPKTDSCKGDSGGSLIKDGRLYGVVTGGPEHFCALSSVFMDVCRYRPWINQISKL